MANPIIKAPGMFSGHYLEITFMGVQYNDPEALRIGIKRCNFDKISCVLLSPTHDLSFQVGKDLFRIPTKPNDPKHQEAIAALLAGLNRNLP